MSTPKRPPRGPALDIDALLEDDGTRIVVCCGSGGVGKTTTAAALGVRAAERGRRTVVLTIDPARRLAQSMGLTELDNTPRRVEGIDGSDGGELHAMMLDMKRTFDEIVEAHAEPSRAEAILRNPFYQSLSAGFAGTQEYMAMEKLGQLKATGDWDLIIVDTPPSRSALDFLDAPERLGSFLDGRFIKVLTGPAKVGGRGAWKFLNAGMTMVTSTLGKVLGAHMLEDVQMFVSAMESMFGGFRERADATYRLLQAPGTAFLVVAAPERDALREAAYFVERLATDAMPLAGLVLNRMHSTEVTGLTAQRATLAAETLEERAEESGVDTSSHRLFSGDVDDFACEQPCSPAAAGVEPDAAQGGSKNPHTEGVSHTGGGKVHKRTSPEEDAAPPPLPPDTPEGPAPTGSVPPEMSDSPEHDGTTHSDKSDDGREEDEQAQDTGDTSSEESYDTDLLAAGLLRLHAERMQVMARERHTRDRFFSVHPEVPVVEVASLPGDVHDLDGLRTIGARLTHRTTADGHATHAGSPAARNEDVPNSE